MSTRFALMFLALAVTVVGCASPMRCDEDRSEAYMDPRPGQTLDLEGLMPRMDRRERYRVPGEENVDRGDANPCLAQAPRVVPEPAPAEREAREGQAYADLRYRMEVVDQDGFDERAQASTARLRLGGTTDQVRGFDAGIAFQTTQVLGSTRYDDTTGSHTQYPVVADPADTMVSEGWARYTSREDFFELTIGRQPVSQDNERFFGTSSFRQLEQTANAATMRLGDFDPVKLDVIYLSQVNRVLGPNHPDRSQAKADTSIGALEYSQAIGRQELGIYFHNMRFDDARESHRNYGLRLSGRLPGTDRFNYRLESARQEGLSNEGPEDVLKYDHLRLGQALESWNWYLGQERLGGDGQDAFQTPLASFHGFNGWGDRFTVTPDAGLVDRYVGVGFDQWGWDFDARFHDFTEDAGNARYGRELGLRAGRELGGPFRFEAKLSRYDGESGNGAVGGGFEDDSTRLWLTLSARFEP